MAHMYRRNDIIRSLWTAYERSESTPGELDADPRYDHMLRVISTRDIQTYAGMLLSEEEDGSVGRYGLKGR